MITIKKSIKRSAFVFLGSLLLLTATFNRCFIPFVSDEEKAEIQRERIERENQRKIFIEAVQKGSLESIINQLSFYHLLRVEERFDDQGNGLLHQLLACKAETAQFISENVIDPWQFILTKSNKLGLTPVHLAVKNDTWSILEPAIKSTEKNKLASDIWFRKFKDYNADSWRRFISALFLSKDNFGNTPLHYALLKEHIDEQLVKALIAYCPCACVVPNNDGQTPISLAASKPKVLALFLDAAYHKSITDGEC